MTLSPFLSRPPCERSSSRGHTSSAPNSPVLDASSVGSPTLAGEGVFAHAGLQGGSLQSQSSRGAVRTSDLASCFFQRLQDRPPFRVVRVRRRGSGQRSRNGFARELGHGHLKGTPM